MDKRTIMRNISMRLVSLKRVKAVWMVDASPTPERQAAEHSYRTTVLDKVLPQFKGADPAKNKG